MFWLLLSFACGTGPTEPESPVPRAPEANRPAATARPSHPGPPPRLGQPASPPPGHAPFAVFHPELRLLVQELVGDDPAGAEARLEAFAQRNTADSFAQMMLAWSHHRRGDRDGEAAARAALPAHRRGAYDFFVDRPAPDQRALVDTYLLDSCHQNQLDGCAPVPAPRPADYPAFEQLAWASHREDRLSTWLHQPTDLRADDVGERLGIGPGMTVADVGAGEGWFTVPFALRVGETGQAVGVEVEPSYLRLLDHVAAHQPLPQLRTLSSRPGDASLPEGAFDLVFVSEVMKAVVTDAGVEADASLYEDKALPFVQTLAAGVAPGGRLVWIEHEVPVGTKKGTSVSLLSRLADDAGLTVTEVSNDYGPLQVMVIAEKR